MVRYALSEDARSCKELLLDPATRLAVQILAEYDLPALPGSTLDIAVLQSGQTIVGEFDTETVEWRDASPGHYDLEAGVMRFGPPRIGHLAEIRGCHIGSVSGGGQITVDGCIFVRRLDMTSGADLRERYCENTGRMTVAGAWMDLGEGYALLDMQTGEMREGVVEMRRALEAAGLDPDVLTGAVPQGGYGALTDYRQIPGFEDMMGGN
jgi:hypothetical protein